MATVVENDLDLLGKKLQLDLTEESACLYIYPSLELEFISLGHPILQR